MRQPLRIALFSAVLAAAVALSSAAFFSMSKREHRDEDDYSPISLVLTVANIAGILSVVAATCIYLAPPILGHRSLAGFVATVLVGIGSSHLALLQFKLLPKNPLIYSDGAHLALVCVLVFVLSMPSIYLEEWELRKLQDRAEMLVALDAVLKNYKGVKTDIAGLRGSVTTTRDAARVIGKIVATPEAQAGFKKLRDNGQLDRTIEAVIVRFEHLFATEIGKYAKWRLANAEKLS